MRICLLGDFSGSPDEGMKNISKSIRDALSPKHDVLALNSCSILKRDFFLGIRRFSPEIVHYLHGPTIRSLIVLRGLKSILGNGVGIVVSATRPFFSKYSRWGIPFLRPDLVLTQSIKFEVFFQKMGCKVSFMPNGVDCKKFDTVSSSKKRALRQKLGLPLNETIVLHVGHIKSNRNLNIFKYIQQIESIQVVIVGGTTEKFENNLKQDLANAGIIIFHEYLEDISKVYKTADLFVFPIMANGDGMPETYNQVGAIDLPLSVLEAMACNLPVVTTRFGALPRLFGQGEGLYYAEDEENIVSNIISFSCKSVCRTREKVLPCDWDQIIARIESEYHQMLHGCIS